MPVYSIKCPECGHEFQGAVLAGTQEPKIWQCSKCGGNKAKPDPDKRIIPHPLEFDHGSGCPCCH